MTTVQIITGTSGNARRLLLHPWLQRRRDSERHVSKQFPVLAVPLLESLPKNCLVIPSAQIWIRPNRSVDREQQVYKKCFFSLSCPRRIERYKSEHDRRSERGRLKKGARTFNSERDRRARTSTLNRRARCCCNLFQSRWSRGFAHGDSSRPCREEKPVLRASLSTSVHDTS